MDPERPAEKGNVVGGERSRHARRRRILDQGNVLVILVMGGCLALIWMFKDCLIPRWERVSIYATPSKSSSDIVRYQVSSPSPSSTGVLECFQVHQPIYAPDAVAGSGNIPTAGPVASANSCTVTQSLMKHDFAFSYGIPFVGNYSPPNCSFNRVIMNFTVTSRGRQFDRLALMYFGDTEVWRTSTAEPTTNGIRWTFLKDMTEFMYFWNSPQKIIFDLGNLVDDTYTGIWHTTLTATFFNVLDIVNHPADLIVPISARKAASDAASVFALPADNAINTVRLPRNINRALFSVAACGQGAEEFWWGNVLQSDIDTFLPTVGSLYGYSPFREVQVLIDGQLAGVQWPFPTIFTGGVVPGLWRPIVGLDAFDLREHEIDISPWLPLLCDGNDHTFEIKVVGIHDGNKSGTLTERVGSSWYVTGKIFIWLDPDPSSVTTGDLLTMNFPEPIIDTSSALVQDGLGANDTLIYTTGVQRTISITTFLKTQYNAFHSSWNQSLTVSNYGQYTAAGAVQVVNHTTEGNDTCSSCRGLSGPSLGGYETHYTYPLYAITTYLPTSGGGFTLDAAVTRGLTIETKLSPAGSALLKTRQNGTASYATNGKTSWGSGRTAQAFVSWGDRSLRPESYGRWVEAVNDTVVRDREQLNGEEMGRVAAEPGEHWQTGLRVRSPREAIGRGLGEAKRVLVQGGGG